MKERIAKNLESQDLKENPVMDAPGYTELLFTRPPVVQLAIDRRGGAFVQPTIYREVRSFVTYSAYEDPI